MATRLLLCTLLPLILADATWAEPRVELHDGRLTIEADGAPVDAVLQAIGEAAGLEVPSLDGATETYTGRMTAVPLADGLRRLLGPRSYTLLYDAAGNPERLILLEGPVASLGADPVIVEEVAEPEPVEGLSPAEEEAFVAERIVLRQAGARIVAVRRLDRLPPERAAFFARRMVAIEREPAVRAELAVALGKVPGDASVTLLQQLLTDPDLSVRAAALAGLGVQGGPEAAAQLRRIASDGRDPLSLEAERLLACAGQADCGSE